MLFVGLRLLVNYEFGNYDELFIFYKNRFRMRVGIIGLV